MNLGAFLVVAFVAGWVKGDTLDDFRGLGWRVPFVAVTMGIFLFSLTGLPPLAGVVGKFYLFAAVIKAGVRSAWYYVLAVIGVLNSVVSLYYYARVVKVMFLDRPEVTERIEVTPLSTTILGTLAVPVVFLIVFFWGPLAEFSSRSLHLLGM